MSNNNLIQAAEKALDALLHISNRNMLGDADYLWVPLKELRAALAAAKQVVPAEPCEFCATSDSIVQEYRTQCIANSKEIIRLEAALAEKQGEHVAEVTANGDTIRLNRHLPVGTRLYLHPDLVKAEPLTEEERDDAAVDRFAIAMKEKLASARSKGRGGWQECDPNDLKRMLRDHVEKGDPRDVANFCMFLWNLGHGIDQKEGK